MLRLDSFPNPILKKSNTLIKVRLCVSGVAYAHLVIMANWLLAIDFSQAEDLTLRSYQETRWKLITTWFNLLAILYHPTSMYCDWRELKGITMLWFPRYVFLYWQLQAYSWDLKFEPIPCGLEIESLHYTHTFPFLLTILYHPTSMYCDWRELKGEAHWRHVKLLGKARYLLFTSILLPTTSFGDILFWRVWNKDRELIAPEAVDAIVPFWTQHCMHTVSLIVILLDLVLVPRERPKSMMPGFALLTFFLTSYVIVCAQSFLNGEYIYPGLKTFSGMKLPLLIVYVYVENFFYYTSQWLIVDMVWGTGRSKKIKDYKIY